MSYAGDNIKQDTYSIPMDCCISTQFLYCGQETVGCCIRVHSAIYMYNSQRLKKQDAFLRIVSCCTKAHSSYAAAGNCGQGHHDGQIKTLTVLVNMMHSLICNRLL